MDFIFIFVFFFSAIQKSNKFPFFFPREVTIFCSPAFRFKVPMNCQLVICVSGLLPGSLWSFHLKWFFFFSFLLEASSKEKFWTENVWIQIISHISFFGFVSFPFISNVWPVRFFLIVQLNICFGANIPIKWCWLVEKWPGKQAALSHIKNHYSIGPFFFSLVVQPKNGKEENIETKIGIAISFYVPNSHSFSTVNVLNSLLQRKKERKKFH